MMLKPFLNVFLLSLTCAGLQAQNSSVSQVKDISAGMQCYEAVKSLSEHYGVIHYLPDGNFRPDSVLTRVEFIWLLGPSLSVMQETLSALTDDIADKDAVNNIEKSLVKPYSYGVKKKKIRSVRDYKDVQSGDDFIETLQWLTEKYGIVISDADKSFSPAKPMTFHEVSAIFSNAFSYTAVKDEQSAITRGDFAIALDGLLNDMTGRMNEAVEKLKKKS